LVELLGGKYRKTLIGLEGQIIGITQNEKKQRII
jgi:hypothetical protein